MRGDQEDPDNEGVVADGPPPGVPAPVSDGLPQVRAGREGRVLREGWKEEGGEVMPCLVIIVV